MDFKMTVPKKFAAIDNSYLANRKQFSAKVGLRELWSVIDHWPLYVGVSNLARSLAIYEILKEQSKIPGDIAEFGSWRGANLMFMAKTTQILDPYSPRQVHCFESFEGLQNFRTEDGKPQEAGTYKGSLEELQEMLTLYGLSDSVAIHKGRIEKTLPKLLGQDGGLTFSLVYFDADLYEPAITVLEQCHARMAKGGVFVFDEWNYPEWPGEGRAVREFMDKRSDFYEMSNVSRTRQPSLLLRKIR
jgi:hypothetical protein